MQGQWGADNHGVDVRLGKKVLVIGEKTDVLHALQRFLHRLPIEVAGGCERRRAALFNRFEKGRGTAGGTNKA